MGTEYFMAVVEALLPSSQSNVLTGRIRRTLESDHVCLPPDLSLRDLDRTTRTGRPHAEGERGGLNPPRFRRLSVSQTLKMKAGTQIPDKDATLPL